MVFYLPKITNGWYKFNICISVFAMESKIEKWLQKLAVSTEIHSLRQLYPLKKIAPEDRLAKRLDF
jgi:hypothetical protein